jgi:hypothetical protein
MVPRVPARVRTLAADGTSTTLRDVLLSDLEEEAHRAFGSNPTQVRWAAANDQYPGARCGLIAF